MIRGPRLLAAIMVLFTLVIPRISPAAWQLNGSQVGTGTDIYVIGIVPDGNGGAFVGWKAVGGVGIARISGEGNILWLKTVATSTYHMKLVGDGASGVQLIVNRQVSDGADVVIQRVTAEGTLVFPVWTKVGHSAPQATYCMDAVLLDNNETQLVWTDRGDLSSGTQLYGQRLDAEGNALWEDGRALLPPLPLYTGHDGVVVLPAPAGKFFAISYTFSDYKGIEQLYPASARLFDSAGTPGPPPVSLSDYFCRVAPDGIGGIFGAYPASNIYVTRVLNNGNPAWGPVMVDAVTYAAALVVADGSGGGFFVWGDRRNGDDYDVYAQHLDALGAATWPIAGVPLVTGGGDQVPAETISDGAGGAIIFWNQADDLYAQRIGPDGSKLWGSAGVPVAIAPGNQREPHAVLDGNGGVLVTWTDTRLDPNTQFYTLNAVYAQRLSLADGAWGNTVAVAISDFSARMRGASVVLNATLRSNLGVDKVNVYRASGAKSFMLRESLGAPARGQFEYVDADIQPGTSYRYKLIVDDADGEFASQIVTVTTPSITASLEQNTPNPFNPETRIRFVLAAPARATVEIYAATGERVRTLYDRITTAGTTSLVWDGTDDRGKAVSSGVYLYQLTAGKSSQTRKMVLLK